MLCITLAWLRHPYIWQSKQLNIRRQWPLTGEPIVVSSLTHINFTETGVYTGQPFDVHASLGESELGERGLGWKLASQSILPHQRVEVGTLHAYVSRRLGDIPPAAPEGLG